MKSEEFPVIIDGKTYFVDRTFSGDPAIYYAKDFTSLGHVSEEHAIETIQNYPIPDGCVIILARKA